MKRVNFTGWAALTSAICCWLSGCRSFSKANSKNQEAGTSRESQVTRSSACSAYGLKSHDLLKLALVVALLSIAAFAQATMECTAFPCPLQITTAQCPSGLPCSITVTTGSKFSIGDKVIVTHAGPTLAVRMTAASAGGLLGVQPNGRSGIVTAGPVTDVTGDHKVRYDINYAVGVDGWSVQDYLERSSVQPPVCNPPNTVVNGVCTPPVVPCNPPSTIVNGVCTAPPLPTAITISPNALSFTAALNTDSTIQFVTLTNSTSGALSEVPTMAPAPFAWGNKGTCQGPIAANSTCTISALCHPTAAGTFTGNLTIDAGSPNVRTLVALSCSAVAPVTKSVLLNWIAPGSDGAASYNLYRAGVKVGNVSGSVLTFTDTPVPSGTYTYTARTVDSSGKESIDSNVVTVTIP